MSQHPSFRKMVQRLVHGAGAQGAATVIHALASILLVPLYLRAWSIEAYGEWMALYSLVLYLNNLDAGISAASLNAATMAYARCDWADFKRVQGTGWAIAIALGATGCGVAAVVAVFTPLGPWLGLRNLAPGEARMVALGLGCATALGIPGRQITNVFASTGQYARAVWLQNLFSVGNAALIAALLVYGARPGTLAFSLLAASMVYMLATAVVLRNRDRRLVPRLRDARWSTARKLGSPTADFAVSLLAVTLALHGPVLLISRILGGGAVAVFATTRTLVNLIKTLCGLVQWPVRMELAALAAVEARAKLSRLFRLFFGAEALVCTVLGAGLWVAGEWLIRVWTQGRIEPGAMFLKLMIVAVILDTLASGLAWGAVATNRLRVFAVAQLICATVSLVLMAGWVSWLGLVGAPLAVLAATAMVLVPAGLREAGRTSGVDSKETWRRVVGPAVFAVGLGLALAECVQRFSPTPVWLSAGFAGLVALVVSGLVVGVMMFHQQEREGGVAVFLKRVRGQTTVAVQG